MASYGGELLLEVASPIIFLPSPILLPLIFKKQMTPLMKNIQDLQAPHGATSCFGGVRLHHVELQAPHDVAPCGACRNWIFFINGVLCCLKIMTPKWRRRKGD